MFDREQLLSDWPDCTLEVRCPTCPHMTMWPVRLLRERHGDRSFKAILAAMRCKSCGGLPAPVYLVAGRHREFLGGPQPDWAVELVPAARAG